MSGDFTFLKGNIETIILCSLYNTAKYGYEIAKEIKERTSNRYEIKQPTLYSYLKRLEEDELIESYWGESSNGGRRRYYKLTNSGRANCEQFISEWEYQRTIMSDLVDGTAEGSQISQEEATPLFGRRSPKRSRKNELQNALDEQDEIARRLRELTGDDDSADDEATEPIVVAEQRAEPVTEQTRLQQQSIFDTVATEPVPEQTIATSSSLSDEDAKARFEVNQDSAEDFLQDFEVRAREASERTVGATEHSEGENYQHVLMGVLGDQLDGIEQLNPEPTQSATHYYEDHPAVLEDVADSLAKEGIRIHIYNHATAAYKSKMLIPQAKVLCQTSWLTYLVAFLYFGIVALTSISHANWSPFIITLAVLLLVPIGFSIYAIVDPTRKDKPKFNFRIAIIVTATIGLIIVLAAIGLSALSNIEFSDYVAVSKQILLPLGIAILFPIFVVIYELLYRQY